MGSLVMISMLMITQILGIYTVCATNIFLVKASSSEGSSLPVYTNPHPKLPFSQSVLLGNTVYVSGQIGMLPNKKLAEGFEGQLRATMNNIAKALKPYGLSMNDVLKTTILLADIKDYKTLNPIYKEYFTENFPARMAFQAAALPLGALVEIDAIAFKSN